MKRLFYIALAATALFSNSCTVANQPEQGGVVQLQITPGIASAPKTRGVVFPAASNAMPNRSSFGLFVCDHYNYSGGGSNPYTEYAARYNNIRAYRNDSGNWRYNYSGYTDFEMLYLAAKDADRDGMTDITADIFAYAPYQEDLATLEAVPFSISGAVDVMYAEQNTDPDNNKNIDPAAYSQAPYNGHLPVPLTFRHALSLLEFDFTVKNENYEHPMDPASTQGYRLQSIQLTKKHPSAHLYSSGTMNAMNEGALSDLTPADAITVSFLTPNGSNYGYIDFTSTAQAYFLQVPTQAGDAGYADGDYEFTFTFSGQTFPVKFTLLREHIKHSDNVTYGFQPGCKYTFHFIIDNYIHLEGVTIGEWETVDTPVQKTEI